MQQRPFYTHLFPPNNLIDEQNEIDKTNSVQINPVQLIKQKQDMIKKVFKHQIEPTQQQIQYAFNVINLKYGEKYGIKNSVRSLYLKFLQDQRRRILLDSHCRLQPNLYKLYEPDAGSEQICFDGNKHYQKLTLDHQIKRLKSTRQNIQHYCNKTFEADQFKDFINSKKKWPYKLAKNKPAFYLTSAFRTVILQLEIYISLGLTVKIIPMTRAEFDTIQSKLLIQDSQIPRDFFQKFYRVLKTTYGIKTKLVTERQVILLYRQIRQLVNIQKVIADDKIGQAKHRQLYKRWTNEMNNSLMKFYCEDPKINIVTEKMEAKYPQISHLIDTYLITLRLQILIRSSIKWIIIVATQSRFQNPLQFRQEDRSVITRGPQLQFGRFQLVKLYSNRYFYEDKPVEERQFWRRQLYEQAFHVIEVIEQGLIRHKKRKNRQAGNVFKDKLTDEEELIKRRMKEAEFENYRHQVKDRYAIYKKQLQRQKQFQTKVQLEKRINQRDDQNKIVNIYSSNVDIKQIQNSNKCNQDKQNIAKIKNYEQIDLQSSD